jgi:hypothetical protein
MEKRFAAVKVGVLISMFVILFGVSMGVGFGIFEDAFKQFITDGIAAFPQLHDGKSADKIWRYAQRAHFHAGGIGSFTLVLSLVVMCSSLSQQMKRVSSTLIGLGGTYSLAWLSMFVFSPSMGRDGAHHYIVTEIFTYIGVGCLLLGLAILFANLVFGYNKTPEEV